MKSFRDSLTEQQMMVRPLALLLAWASLFRLSGSPHSHLQQKGPKRGEMCMKASSTMADTQQAVCSSPGAKALVRSVTHLCLEAEVWVTVRLLVQRGKCRSLIGISAFFYRRWGPTGFKIYCVEFCELS